VVSMYLHIMANAKILVTYHFLFLQNLILIQQLRNFLLFLQNSEVSIYCSNVCLQRLHQQVLHVLSISVEIQIF